MGSGLSIPISDRTPIGYFESRSTKDYAPESLRHIAAYLSSAGYTVVIEKGDLICRPHPQGVLSTTSGWRLIWSHRTTAGLDVYGSLWVAGGVEGLGTPFTSMLGGNSHPS